MRVKTSYSDKAAELRNQIKEFEKELVYIEQNELDEIVDKELYIPMDRYKEEFDKVRKEIRDESGERWDDAINVELVIQTREDESKGWNGPFVLLADDAEGCEWPSYDKDGRFYWNTYNCGILQWEEEYNSYIWWRHHTITYVDILGFVSIEEER